MTARSKKKASKKRSPDTGVAGLMKELWQAAVKLRGSIEPADYKRYVLPIIFLRFLSLRFENLLSGEIRAKDAGKVVEAANP